MSDEHNPARPRTAPPPPRRRPAFAQHPTAVPTHPIHQLAPDLEPPWTKHDTDTPDRTALYTHPEGHRIGLRLQGSNLIIQTWTTAGPDLPPVPASTPHEEAELQAANDARLQPGRTWHTTIAIRHTDDLAAAVNTAVRDRLIPALTHKPKTVQLPATTAQTSNPGTATTTETLP
ncbi:hypothetical protein ACFYZ5_35210 [Streptomyces chartreusis]|uniref:hypothetical protein n=1 Tax=Streptomyces chartreusis TaxID=1969 RepID=UPI00369F077B